MTKLVQSLFLILIFVMVSTAFAASPAAKSVQVSISNYKFVPDTLTVKVGQSITWTNKDSVGHTVTSQDGTLNSGTIDPGKTYSFTFTTAGSYDYFCSIHPQMTGKVTVTK